MIFTQELTYLPIVQSVAKQYNVPPALVLAHMKQESAFNPNAYRAEPAIGDASYGLMQVLVGTAKKLDSSATSNKLLDPAFNIAVGTKYIADNLSKYGGNVQDAIAAYNAGSAYKDTNGNYISKSGNKAVQSYVDKVYSNYQYYTDWLNKGAQEFDITMINPYLAYGFAALALTVIITTFVFKKEGGEQYV